MGIKGKICDSLTQVERDEVDPIKKMEKHD